MPLKKIQLIIRDVGVGSRRVADQIIREGRVTLNGAVITDPAVTVDPEKDHIKVDGKLLKPIEPAKVYYLFNKPRNVVSTMKDPEGRPCIGDLLKTFKQRLFTVGRLDLDREGLMILTNDGLFAQKLGHPSQGLQRTYLVKVRGNPDDKTLGTDPQRAWILATVNVWAMCNSRLSIGKRLLPGSNWPFLRHNLLDDFGSWYGDISAPSPFAYLMCALTGLK